MKKLFIICGGLAVLSVTSCKKTETAFYQSQGEILGPDGRFCAQCGGYFIRIDNSSKEYRAFSLPENSGIDLVNDPKPIRVSLNWQPDTGARGEWGVIVVTAVERR